MGVLAVLATYHAQAAKITAGQHALLSACERGNALRRQVRILNIVVQDTVAAGTDPSANAKLKRLRDQYNGTALADVPCSSIIPSP